MTMASLQGKTGTDMEDLLDNMKISKIEENLQKHKI